MNQDRPERRMIPYPLFNVNPRAEQDSVAFERKMAEAVATAKQLGHAHDPRTCSATRSGASATTAAIR